jgi:Terminase large subunit, T4likevirus-type, N-terminal
VADYELPPGTHKAWEPQKGSQVLFLTCPIYEVLYEGTRGPGKTDALLMDFAQHVGTGLGPDWRGILFRRTYKELGDVVAKTQKWFPQIFPGAHFNKVEFTWYFPSGEMLLLRHGKNVDDYWNYHGHAYPWIGWEELTNWADDGLFRKMMSCCRSTNPKVPKKLRSTCNPYGAGHNWVKKRYHLPHGRGIVIKDAVDSEGNREPHRVAIHGSIHENRILLDADPEYITRLRASARNRAELRAWLHGDWGIVAGGMFDDVWEPRIHVLEPFKVPKSWRIDRAFDWGSSKPFSVGWWAQSDGTDYVTQTGKIVRTVRGDLFRIAEWYGCSPRESNVGLNMLAKDIAKGRAALVRADPQLRQARRGGRGHLDL